MQVIVKYLRQIVWHIVPAAVVFLIVLGVQLSIVGFLATVLILISGGEGDIEASRSLTAKLTENAPRPGKSLATFKITLQDFGLCRRLK